MTKAIVIHETGGPEVLRWEDVQVPAPAAGQVAIRHTAIGLNFIDVYVRTGAYRMSGLPVSPGMEAAGVVEAVGPGVTGFAVGDRVAYVAPTPGAYVQSRVIDAAVLVKIPEGVSDRDAAALMLKGMTAETLLFRMSQAAKGDTLLVHAAAGGVGQLLTAWAKSLGCTVIGTVSTDAKVAAARAAGADHVIVTGREGIAERVEAITGGKGCRYVYDGVGRDTMEASFAAVAPFGGVVNYGNASGAPEPVVLGSLSAKCVTVARPSIFPFIKDRARLEAIAAHLFEAIKAGILRADIGQTWPLEQAAEAHRALESRATTGQTILIP